MHGNDQVLFNLETFLDHISMFGTEITSILFKTAF